MHTSSHKVLYGLEGLIETELPLDLGLYERLVGAVPAWASSKPPQRPRRSTALSRFHSEATS